MAISVPEYECLYADVGSNGTVKSSLLQGMQNGSVKLPDDEKFSNGGITPYVFLGDDAFALKRFTMKPFPQQGLTGERRVYNYRHSRARRISENLFEIFANRRIIFCTTINLEPKYVEDVIPAALILYNMLIKSLNSVNVYRPTSFADCILEDGEVSKGEWRTNVATDTFYLLQVPRKDHNASLYAKLVREKFMDYFVNDGEVEWQ